MTSPTKPVALVTGASSGFGALIAEALTTRGFRVIGTSRSGGGGPPGIEMLALDVDRDASVTACMARLFEQTGHIDVLVNNAGRAMVGAAEETSPDEARALFETNLFGVMRVTSAVLPGMRARRTGRIINLGSVSGFVGLPFHGIYAASKHALAGYSEALRYELRPFGVWVSLVEPAAHRTGIQMSRPAQLDPVYDAGRRHVEHYIRDLIDHGPDPRGVARVVLAAATRAAPRLHYRVGGQARLAAWARRLLPGRLFEQFMRRELRLPTG
jgi:short-subunit dehydrogenase